jgi:hypothetical protein
VVPGIGGTELPVPGDYRGGSGFGAIASWLGWAGAARVGEHPRLQPLALIKTLHRHPRLCRPACRVDRGGSALAGARVDDGTKPERDLDAIVVAIGSDFRLGLASAAQELEDAIQPRL